MGTREKPLLLPRSFLPVCFHVISKEGIMTQRCATVLVVMLLVLGSYLLASDVPYEFARDVALHKATHIYGTNVSIGQGIPYYDLNDELMGYEFGISFSKPFPDGEAILHMLREKQDRIYEMRWLCSADDLVAMKKERAGIGRYATIFVSASSADVPIPAYGEGLPQYYQRYDEAREYAWDHLGEEPILKRMYYLTPFLRWYKFAAGGNEVLVRMHGARCAEPDEFTQFVPESCPDTDILEKRHEALWQRLRQGDYSVLNGGRAGYIDSVPEYDWSYGCSPTASSMVFGYWDERGYDRLIDWYWNHLDPCTGQLVWNMPNVQQELAIAMNTDTNPSSPGCGGTSLYNIASGQNYVSNALHGYSFSSGMSPQGTVGNDFLWSSYITPQIDVGRPFNWTVIYYWFQGDFINHSVECHGYTDDKYCVIFTTWMWGEQEWYYYTYHNGQYCWPYVYTCAPGGSEPHKVTIETPDGGEIWYAGSTDTIRWNTDGGSVDHLAIEFTRNGGNDWQSLSSNAPNTGWFAWYIQPDTMKTYRAKIRLRGYSSGNQLLGADCSQSDFTIMPAMACTVTVTAPNGGEVWGVGESHDITWSTNGESPHHMTLYYSSDGGTQWNSIITYPNTGSFSWTVPDDTTSNAFVKVKALTQSNELIGEDISDGAFSIVAAGIEEQAPTLPVKPFSVTVTPLPMTDHVQLIIHGKRSESASVVIMDAAGRVIQHFESGSETITWNGNDRFGNRVRSGLYFYRVCAGSDIESGKIVKIR